MMILHMLDTTRTPEVFAPVRVDEEVDAVLQPVDAVERQSEMGVFGLVVCHVEDSDGSDKGEVGEADGEQGPGEAEVAVVDGSVTWTTAESNAADKTHA